MKQFYALNTFLCKKICKLDVSIPVPNFNMWEKNIPFKFVNFGISKFVSDGHNENFLVYTCSAMVYKSKENFRIVFCCFSVMKTIVASLKILVI